MVTPREAEVACENYWKSRGFETRRVLRARFNKMDFFGCDVIAQNDSVRHWVQVTMAKDRGATIAHKRRDLEKRVWLYTDDVWLFQLVTERYLDEKTQFKVRYYFRPHHWLRDMKDWTVQADIEVPKEWFKVGPRIKDA